MGASQGCKLAAMYRQPGEVLFDIQVVVSEFVSNALGAGCRHLSLSIEGHHDYLRVAVTTRNTATPTNATWSPPRET